MISPRWCVLVLCAVLIGTRPNSLGAQSGTLQVKLETPLESRRTKVGAPVVASTLAPWSGAHCDLKAGSAVTGHVVAAQSLQESQREANLAVVFDRADCNERHDIPTSLLLVALLRVEETEAERDARNNPGIYLSNDAVPMAVVGRSGGRGAYVGAGVVAAYPKKERQGPGLIESGQVIGLTHLALGVGAGPAGASVLHSEKHDFSLDTRVVLVLQPVQPPEEIAASTPGHTPDPPRPPVAPPSALAPPAPDPTEVCAAVDCNVADLGGEPMLAAGAFRATSLLPFGYNLRRHLRRHFDGDTTLTYLSPQQVLVTFDTHRLRSRSPGIWPEQERRPIRAMLVNGQTGAVERVLDWTVDGSGPYLWPAGSGHIAVATGGLLEVLGPDLKPTLRFPVDGKLSWVASSPSGDEIALAVTKERHSRETHAFIRDRTGFEPEEDLEVRLIDRSGTVRLTRLATSRMQPPVLTDGGGEVVLRNERAQRWSIREGKEGTRKEAHTIAVVQSACEPSMSTLPHGALFVAGCSDTERWYRVLQSSGKAMLAGKPSRVQIEQDAVGGEDVYAIRVVQARSALGGREYEAKDLADERIAVYRATNNQHTQQLLLATTTSFPEASRNFALSPDGGQLALLTRSDVQFYRIEGSAPTR